MSLRVLIVEDSEDDALLLVARLKQRFGDIAWRRVESSDTFSLALTEETWDVVVSDHRMPRFSSTEALGLLGSSELDVPFIIVSGAIGEDAAVAAMQSGASDYVIKGELRRLVPAVERELREAAGRGARRKAETALRSLEIENARTLETCRDRGQSLTTVSHELRTPLNAILGFSEVLIDGKHGCLNEKQAHYLQIIHDSGRHLMGLVDGLLDMSKAEAGKMTVTCAPCALDPIADEAVATLHALSDLKQVTLVRTSPVVSTPAVHGDGLRVKQMLYNLVSNAIKFTDVGGQVTVTCVALSDGKYVRTSVVDTGVGISPEDLGRLFVPFTQLDNARGTHGTGLGLALVKQLAELMRGRAGVESALGSGSTFFFELPVEIGARG